MGLSCIIQTSKYHQLQIHIFDYLKQAFFLATQISLITTNKILTCPFLCIIIQQLF